MDRGPDAQPSALAPVPAYPRRAVEQYLADVRTAWEELQATLEAERARHAAALDALSATDESHRVLGSMMVEAQQDLMARRNHAAEAAAMLLGNADQESERIVRSARRQAMALLGQPEPEPEVVAQPQPQPQPQPEPEPIAAEADDERHDEPPWPRPPHRAARPVAVADPPAAPDADDEPAVHAVAAADAAGVVELWPSRRPASFAREGLRWRPRWLRSHDPDWPVNASQADESYFTRLRDEMRADGTIDAWFEPA